MPASATDKMRARRLDELAEDFAGHDIDAVHIIKSWKGHTVDLDEMDTGDIDLIIDGLRIAAQTLRGER